MELFSSDAAKWKKRISNDLTDAIRWNAMAPAAAAAAAVC